MSERPGRTCPVDYRYSAAALAGAAPLQASTLYVVGGLYGNPQALNAVLDLVDRERSAAHIVFNGDFNWFNADPKQFVLVNEGVLAHQAIRGNVETELARDEDAGCGCGYPEWVDDRSVDLSNCIMRRLKRTALQYPVWRARLAELPMYRVYSVGGLSVAVVHGDAESLAGWGFAQEALGRGAARERIRNWFVASRMDVFACTHTCLPVLFDTGIGERQGLVVNNGAAGMPNFSGDPTGLVTRIATSPAERVETVYGCRVDGVFVDAVRLRFDVQAWLAEFTRCWPPGSAAEESYGRRLRSGPDYRSWQALRIGDDR